MVQAWRSLNLWGQVLLLGVIFALAAGGWLLASPLFLDQTVSEPFPVVLDGPQADGLLPMSAVQEAETSPGVAIDAAGTSGANSGANQSRSNEESTVEEFTVEESTVAENAGEAEQGEGDAEVATSGPQAAEDTQEVNPAPSVSGPVLISEGTFNELDSAHRGAGLAQVYELPDGQRVLRLEEFEVTNGPDLYVYLSGSGDPRRGSDVHANGSFELARLKGNIGSQNYELPADLDLSAYQSVVIYCKAFSVVFSTAEIAAP